MSLSILEVLYNAKINLVDNRGHGFAASLGAQQLHNATVLLEKGYGVNECFDDIMEDYSNVENVPEKPIPTTIPDDKMLSKGDLT